MHVEPHSADTMDAYITIRNLVNAGKLPSFTAMVEGGYSTWQTICILEEELLTFERQNPASKATDGWLMAVGYAQDCADERGRTILAIEQVPAYVGWGKVQAWLTLGSTALVFEPSVGTVHLYDAEQFEKSFAARPVVVCGFRDDSAIVMNAEFRAINHEAAAFVTEVEGVL